MVAEKTQHLIGDLGALLPLVVSNLLNAVGAIVILLIGWWLSGKADRLVVKALGRTPHFDPMLQGFFGSLARYSILTVTGLAVLAEFGIQTASLVAVLGAAGLTIGLAMQGTLSHLAAGVMLLIFRPFRIGHKVQVGGNTGIVTGLTLFWTELETDDNVQVIVPNGGVWGQALRNYSVYPAPPPTADARFRVPETVDPDDAIGIVRACLEAEPRISADPAVRLLFDTGADAEGIEVVASFSAGDDTAAARSDLIRAVHAAFAAMPPSDRRSPKN